VNKNIKRAPNLLSCLLVSRSLHSAALSVTYRHVKVVHPAACSQLLVQIHRNPSLGAFFRSLEFSPISSAISPLKDENSANPMLEMLRLTPLLRNFKAQKDSQRYLDESTLKRLFCELNMIESIDLSESCSPLFTSEFTNICQSPSFQISWSIDSLNLRGCSDLPPAVFLSIIPQLPKLRFLNVENTCFTVAALASIPTTARLTHLNVNHCSLLDMQDLAHFLASHPSVISTLVSLDAETSPGLASVSEDDVNMILANAPKTLRSLNLKNSDMTYRHVPYLRELSQQLEQLTVGSHLRLRDIETLFLKPEGLNDEDDQEEENPAPIESKYRTVLGALEEASAICKLRRRIHLSLEMVLENKLRYLDVSGMSLLEQGKLRSSMLLGARLEAIEVSEQMLGRFEILGRLCRAVEWDVRSEGRRSWLRRNSHQERK
jgi:hypothetical protein